MSRIVINKTSGVGFTSSPLLNRPSGSDRIYQILAGCVRVALVAKEKLNLWQWADQFVFLDARFTARPGKYDSRYTFFLRGPMEALSDRRVRRVSIVKGAQVGFTTMLANWLMYLVDMDPGPTLLVQPSSKIVKRYVRKELRPRFLDCKRLAKYLPSRLKEEFTTTEMYFRSMDFFATGAGSPAALASLPIKNLALDEEEKFDGESEKEASSVDLAEVRTLSYEETRKILRGCTPTVPEGSITVEVEKGTCEHFYVPCPECGYMQELLFEHFNWKDAPGAKNSDGSWNLDAVAKGTRYECQNFGLTDDSGENANQQDDHKPSADTSQKRSEKRPHACGYLIPQEKKQWMMRRGEWRAHNPNAPADHRSFYLRGELSNKPNWGGLAKIFLETQFTPGGLHHFYNSYLGRPWERTSNRVTKAAIRRIQKESPHYLLGNAEDEHVARPLPIRPVILVMKVDVQQTEFYYSITAIDVEGSFYLLAYGRTVSYAELDRIQDHIWRYDHGDGGPLEEFAVWHGLMDSGYRTKRGASVYNFIHEQGGRWSATKGGGYKGKDAPISETIVLHQYKGTQVEIPLIHYNDDVLKEHFYRFVLKERKMHGYYLPQNLSPEFIDQITAEKLVEKRGEDGRKIHKWQAELDPHWGDDEKIGEIFSFIFPRELLAKMRAKQDAAREQLIETLKKNS